MDKTSPKSKGKVIAERPGTGRKPALRKSVPVGPGEVCGISAFAAGLGISEDFAVAVTCSVLTGIAGPEALLDAPWAARRLPKLDLIISKEDLPACRVIECLSGPVERIDRRLSQNMARADSEAVGYLVHGVFDIDTPKKERREAEDATLRRNLDLLIPAKNGGLKADLAFDPMAQRVEAVLNPRMLVSKGAGRDLPVMVAECHRRCALVLEPGLGLDREGSEPAQVIRALLPILDGTANHNQGGSRGHSRNDIDPSRAHMILTLGSQEREVLAGAGAALLDRLLWLSGNEVKQTTPSKLGEGAMFFDAYQTAIEEIIELRREGHSLMVDFVSPEILFGFHKELRNYEAELAAMGSTPGISVTGLPQTLYWGMWFLRRSLPGGDDISDKDLIKYVFASARRLAGIHNIQVLGLRNAGVVSDRFLVAKRVVEKLQQEMVPMKFRDLARLFGRQNKERILPVLDVLVEAQVLLQGDSGYELGSVVWDDVADSLIEKFAWAGDADS